MMTSECLKNTEIDFFGVVVVSVGGRYSFGDVVNRTSSAFSVSCAKRSVAAMMWWFPALVLGTMVMSGASGELEASERSALAALYASTDGPHWSLNSSSVIWDIANATSNYCTWHGVGCVDPSSGVSILHLEGIGLSGTIPEAVGNLTELRMLNLARNNLTGTLPNSLSACTHLKSFSMYDNGLNGTIPAALGSIASMKLFEIFSNSFSGSLPADLFRGWSTLWKFDARQNFIVGTLPDTIRLCTSLEVFDVSENNITGTLPPNLSQCRLMRRFFVFKNALTGTLPEDYSAWNATESFSLQHNNLSGTLPLSYISWSRIDFFQVESNPLTGTLPAAYGTMWLSATHINVFDTSVSGTIPNEWGNLKAVSSLQLHKNSLSGTLPASFGKLASLRSLNLLMNNFSGTLPVEAWAALRNVQSILLQDNPHLSGTIPTSWGMIFGADVFTTPLVLAVCNTQVCGPRLPILTFGYACAAPSAIDELSASFADSTFSIDWTLNISWSQSAPCASAPSLPEPHHSMEQTLSTQNELPLDTHSNAADGLSGATVSFVVVALSTQQLFSIGNSVAGIHALQSSLVVQRLRRHCDAGVTGDDENCCDSGSSPMQLRILWMGERRRRWQVRWWATPSWCLWFPSRA